MSTVDIREIQAVDAKTLSAVNRLLPQLSNRLGALDSASLHEVVEHPANVVLVASLGSEIVGVLTLVILRLMSGVVARIEDVVVDESARGQGIGQALTDEAVRIATERGARYIDLTSRPERAVAHNVYEKAGFVRRETAVYRFSL